MPGQCWWLRSPTIQLARDVSDTVEQLVSQVAELKEALYWLALERNYYSKLCKIDKLCWEHEQDHGKESIAEKILDPPSCVMTLAVGRRPATALTGHTT